MTLRTPEPFLGPFFFWSQMAQKWPMFPLAVSSRILFSMMGKNVGFCTQKGGQCVRNRVSNEMSLRLKRNVKNKNRSKTKQIQAENGINPSKKLSVQLCMIFALKRNFASTFAPGEKSVAFWQVSLFSLYLLRLAQNRMLKVCLNSPRASEISKEWEWRKRFAQREHALINS